MATVQIKKVLLGNGETLAYRERSGGHIPLVLLHGNMTSSKHWDVVMDKMEESYKIYAVDMRGFGESSYHREITSIKDLSDDLKDWVDEVGLKEWEAACMEVYAAANPDAEISRLDIPTYRVFGNDWSDELTEELIIAFEEEQHAG